MESGKTGEFPNRPAKERYGRRENCASQSKKRFAKRNREKHAILAEVGKEEQHVIHIDDVKWHEVRRAREQELKYLRDFGVYEEVDEREAIAHYQVTPVDTKWIDTNKAFEEEPMQIRPRIVAKEFKCGDRPDLYAVTFRWKR